MMKRDPLSFYIANTIKWLFLIILLLAALLPLVWLFFSSLRTNLELQISPFGWPQEFQWVNYIKALKMANLPRLFLNSILTAASAVLLNITVTSLASFILAREQFKGRDILYTILITGVLIPVIAFMVPYFTLITRVKLYNTLSAGICGGEYSGFHISYHRFYEEYPPGIGRGGHH